jgi:hypothetical protein
LLDDLPSADPDAIGSRRDLRLLNKWMGNARTIERALRAFQRTADAVALAELGAGDGALLLQVAKRLGASWKGTRATLIDLRDLATPETIRGFCEIGWDVKVSAQDALDWCREGVVENRVVMVANLFLHHFRANELRQLLEAIERRSVFFVAVEPRRSHFSLAFSKLVRFIGCNTVTRHDAPASVHAGFCGNEISRLWPGNGEWKTQEKRAGPFGHLFVARRAPVPNHAELNEHG